jgi:peroxidase
MRLKCLLILSVLCISALGSRTRRQACKCKPFSQCSTQFRDLRQFSQQQCSLVGGKSGVCCTDVPKPRRRNPSLSLRNSGSIQLQVPNGVNTGSVGSELRKQAPAPNFAAKAGGDSDVQAFRLINAVRKADQSIYEAGLALLKLDTVSGVSLSLRRGDDEGLDATNSVDIDGICPWTKPVSAGGRKPNCRNQGSREYRTADGSCNNKREPLFGKSSTPFQRIKAPAYSAGLQTRLNQQGRELPGARSITTTVFTTGDPVNQLSISELFVQFGQFIDHDVAHTPVPEINCCNKNAQGLHWLFPDRPLNPDCVPIRVPVTDPFWGPKGRTCIELARNLFSPTLKCKAGQREQVNSLTHWLDAGHTYGSTEDEMEEVRSKSDRRLLKVSTSNTGEVLPPSCPRSGRIPEACEGPCTERTRQCVFSGDFRVNEQPGLTVEHITWIREHNRVALELSKLNSRWSQEKVFQEARRIVIAEWQHIIYNEWLPLALGPEYMQAHDLKPLSPGSPLLTDYDSNMDPRITNEFAAAAFRFGHTMVKSTLGQTSDGGRARISIDLKRSFNSAGNNIQQPDFIENTLRGATRNRAAERDQIFTDDLVNHLFEESGGGGLDLMSINIQRGRERGVPGYNRYRAECADGSFKAVSKIDDLSRDGYISSEEVSRLKTVYDDVEDIDLFVGGVLEEPHRNSLLGPTFKCIVGDQFLRLKRGDRFWYENNHADGFSLAQVNELRKVSLARMICDNFKLNQVQPLVFRTNDGPNSLIDCSDTVSIPKLNLEVFRE